MFRSTFLFSSVALLALALPIACAGSDAEEPTATGEDSGVAVYPDVQARDTGSNQPQPRVCATSCATDSDCANSCPLTDGGSPWCCDFSAKTCFRTDKSVCPAPPSNDASTPPPY
jgi:hypothetical protein